MRVPTRREWVRIHKLYRGAKIAQQRAAVAGAEANLYMEELREACGVPSGAVIVEEKGRLSWVHPESKQPVTSPDAVAPGEDAAAEAVAEDETPNDQPAELE